MDREEKKQKFIELADLIQKTGKLYSDILLSVDIKNNAKMILELETKGDQIQADLDKDFATQKNIPYLAIDRAKLLRKMDTILDLFRLATLNYQQYHNFLPDDFRDKIRVISESIKEMTMNLYEAIVIIYSDFSATLKLVEQIENTRDKVQDLSFNLEGEYFSILDESSGWKKFQAVSSIMNKSNSCIIAIKSASEILTLMAYKYN